MTCPHCSHTLTEAEVRTLHGQLANSLRRSKGGNPKPVGRRNPMDMKRSVIKLGTVYAGPDDELELP